MASNKFKEKVKNKLFILAVLAIIGLVISLGIGVAYSFIIILKMSPKTEMISLIFGDTIKIIIAFTMAWLLRNNYNSNIDTMVSKMELYEMKIFKSILDHEIERLDRITKDDEKTEEETNKIKARLK